MPVNATPKVKYQIIAKPRVEWTRPNKFVIWNFERSLIIGKRIWKNVDKGTLKTVIGIEKKFVSILSIKESFKVWEERLSDKKTVVTRTSIKLNKASLKFGGTLWEKRAYSIFEDVQAEIDKITHDKNFRRSITSEDVTNKIKQPLSNLLTEILDKNVPGPKITIKKS